jgi:hypothetical protein
MSGKPQEAARGPSRKSSELMLDPGQEREAQNAVEIVLIETRDIQDVGIKARRVLATLEVLAAREDTDTRAADLFHERQGLIRERDLARSERDELAAVREDTERPAFDRAEESMEREF